jgi:hypothetical protein
MKSSEMINKIKTLLDIQVSLEERKLENGTVVEAESFEQGKEVFIKTEDEKVAMPVGEYLMEDKEVMLVKEEGIISEMKKDDYKEESEEEEKMEDDGKEADVEDWAGMEKRIKNLEDAIADLKSKVGVTEKEETEDLEESEEEISEDLSKEEEISELKEELSQPASDPIKHSPEAKSLVENVQFSKKKSKSIMDNVLNKIIN